MFVCLLACLQQSLTLPTNSLYKIIQSPLPLHSLTSIKVYEGPRFRSKLEEFLCHIPRFIFHPISGGEPIPTPTPTPTPITESVKTFLPIQSNPTQPNQPTCRFQPSLYLGPRRRSSDSRPAMIPWCFHLPKLAQHCLRRHSPFLRRYTSAPSMSKSQSQSPAFMQLPLYP